MRFKAFFPLGALALCLATVAAAERDTDTLAAPRDLRGKPRGPLPDPALLDGSKGEKEKRPERGMLGEFEMGGNQENDKTSDKVGSSQQQSGGKQQQSKDGKQGGGGGGPKNASEKDGGQMAGDPSQSQQGGGGDMKIPEQSSGAQGAPGGQPGTNSPDGAVASNGAKAEGAQSTGLTGPAGGEAAGQQDGPPGKPGDIQIGDATLLVKTLPTSAAPNIVGVQMPVAGKDTPQAYNAKTPGGGQQSTGSNRNQGVEKGKIMPPGM